MTTRKTKTPFARRLHLALARLPRGGTQVELAKQCGVTPAAVTKWTAGTIGELSGAALFKLARLCRVDPEWLATGEGSPTGAPTKTPTPAQVRACARVFVRAQEALANDE